MKARRVLISILASACFLLTACAPGTFFDTPGGGSPTSGSAPTTLTGNWFLAGSRTPANYPILSTALFVNGSEITGMISVSAQCTSGTLISITDVGLTLTGKIAQDGTFSASGQGQSGFAASAQVSLTGNSPSTSIPTLWTGTYHLSIAGACNFDQTANFSAAPAPIINGTYVGAAAPGNTSSPFGKAAQLSVQLTQGSPTFVTAGAVNQYQIPIVATLSVNGSICASSGSTQGATVPSHLFGDTLLVNLRLNDGSLFTFGGNLNDLAASSLSIYYNTNSGSTCAVGGNPITLKRQ